MHTFLLSSPGFIKSGCYGHRELVSVSAEAQQKLALVITSTVERELIGLINRTDFEFFALKIKKLIKIVLSRLKIASISLILFPDISKY